MTRTKQSARGLKMAYTQCGCWFPVPNQYSGASRQYLPQVQLESHTIILSTTSHTTLEQVFINAEDKKLDEVQYTFPLYDGVSVVGFKCTVASKVLFGVVKEKQQARQDYDEALERGETAGLLEQVPEASDAFTTKIGNVPAGEKIRVHITYLGELKHDAETDGSRFTIPTVIAPRYGFTSPETAKAIGKIGADIKGGIKILVDVALETGSTIRGLQSPSHPIAVTMGRTSAMGEDDFDNIYASATLTLGETVLEKDFIIVVQSKEQGTPRALLETHPTLPNQRALMTTLVPKFNLPNIAPEIVFVVDRSGSMQGKIELLVSALKIFLKSLPANGTKFNICSFGTHFDFLFKKSRTYDQSSLNEALQHVRDFGPNYGGTEMLQPIQATCKQRYKDMPLEVMVLTDGQIWNQDAMFTFINEQKNARFFSLGIGDGASSALVEGIARAGKGFAQFVGENEKMDKRVVRMLKGALTPHITDYRLEVQYRDDADDDFEMVESASDSMKTAVSESPRTRSATKQAISLFDTSAKEEAPNPKNADRFSGLPTIAVPKVLQAPHQIPDLFPFNRTTVYLLLSPEASQKTLKSVILRGTSDHGPLELKMQVQDVGRGETLHQLAAKKAVHELEQGHGWITDLKSDGKPLKSVYEGRWDLMVEREAVRLGVRYQVGGKYCSFVAVEKRESDSMDEDKKESFEVVAGRPKPQVEYEARRARVSYMKAPQASREAVVPMMCAAAAPLPSSPMQQQSPGLFSRASNSLFGGGGTAAASFGGGGFGYRSAAPRKQLASKAARKSAPSSGPVPPPPPAKKKALKKGARSDQDIIDFSDEAMDLDLDEEQCAEDEAAGPLTEDAKMHKIIEMQAFDGSWAASDALYELLGVEKSKADTILAVKDENARASILAVAWLEHKMKSEEDVWEMVVEKAKSWLEGVLGAGNVDKAVADGQSVFSA